MAYDNFFERSSAKPFFYFTLANINSIRVCIEGLGITMKNKGLYVENRKDLDTGCNLIDFSLGARVSMSNGERP